MKWRKKIIMYGEKENCNRNWKWKKDLSLFHFEITFGDFMVEDKPK